ncbi:MAG: hypothetical protein Q9159_004349 [Coniocarpon cinnabarinum]
MPSLLALHQRKYIPLQVTELRKLFLDSLLTRKLTFGQWAVSSLHSSQGSFTPFSIDDHAQNADELTDDAMTQWIDRLGEPPDRIRDRWGRQDLYYNAQWIKVRSEVESGSPPRERRQDVYVFDVIEREFMSNKVEGLQDSEASAILRLRAQFLPLLDTPPSLLNIVMRVSVLECATYGLPTLAALAVAFDGETTRHENGRCAIRGHCGKQSFFGKELPCPDNGLATDPSSDLRQKIVDTCGEKWNSGPVCCAEDQVEALASNLKTAENFIASCPACRSNFYNLFCTFTCSPDQSQFINVTEAVPNKDKMLVTELDNLWTEKYKEGFYESCKDVKFGAANTPAMSFIGGGAKNYSSFLAFLGKKNPPFGSPFQINFPKFSNNDFPGTTPVDETSIPCNSTDPHLRCSCVDCGGSCAELPAVAQGRECHVGAWPCLSFAVVLIYAIAVALLVTAITGHVAYRKRTQSKNERLRMLHDTAMSDDEDEEEIAYPITPSILPTRQYFLNTWCDRAFSQLARICASYPAMTISISFLVIALMSLGWIRFDVERNPVRLWVAPDSAAATEKAFFDANFGPFYRAEQAFLVNDTNPTGPGPVLSYETLCWWFDVEGRVRRLKSPKSAATLDQICYNPTGAACVVQSITGYFGDFSSVDPTTWAVDLQACVDTPSDCRPDWGLPIEPKLVLGGNAKSVTDAKAIVTTWVVSNHQEGTSELDRAIDWEDTVNNLMQTVQWEAKQRGLRVSFNTEISLEQELNKTTNTDVKIVVVSYIIMFIYASLALGSTTLALRQIMKTPSVALVQSKFMLGVIGIVIVLLSVSASVGLFSAAGVKVTLIIAEVIPFLVLAIGVDNIFLIVHEFERVNASHPDAPVEERLAKSLGRMGPSILLSATMETVAFALGAVVGMPAVRNFAIYAAGAVVINALLQVTMFVSALALNQQRVEAGRADCVPCLRVRQPVGLYEDEHVDPEDTGLQRFIRRTYAPALLGNRAKVLITALFVGLFTAGLALLPTLKLGLDQRIAIPSDSYLIPYFNDLYDYFNAGPPLYFVTRSVNATHRPEQQQLCGRFSTCNSFSLAGILEQERKRPSISYISDSAASWVDDFFLWLNPTLGDAGCTLSDGETPCFADREPPWNVTLSGMPEGMEYVQYLQKWLHTPTDESSPLGGQAGYSNAVVVDNSSLSIPASHFRTSHTPLRSQDDFISALAAARRVATGIESYNPGVDVFPYSKFYIFFDMYATITRLTISLLAAAIASCFVISAVLLGSLRTALVVALTVTMTVVDIAGAMALFNVSLNAITLVNLVISVGISLEFCAHIARAFQFPRSRSLADAAAFLSSPGQAAPVSLTNGAGTVGNGLRNAFTRRMPSSFTAARTASVASATRTTAKTASQTASLSRHARVLASLASVGGSVFSGITLTKLLGVCVLAFTRSKIFEVYYFRVWLALVVLGALHALVWLPVALAWMGGNKGWKGVDGEGGWEEDLRRRRVWDGEEGDWAEYED